MFTNFGFHSLNFAHIFLQIISDFNECRNWCPKSAQNSAIICKYGILCDNYFITEKNLEMLIFPSFYIVKNGVPGEIRTRDPRLRSQLRFQNTYQLLLTPIKHKQSINIGKTMLFVYLY